ncbi:unnamed protein product, partial [Prorocentrum cordatum]
VEEERSARVGDLATHASATEVRLAAVQELVSASLKEGRLHQDDALATLTQRVETDLVRSRQEALGRAQRLEASAAAAAAAVEARCADLDGRLERQTAALGASVAVALAGTNATLKQSLAELDGRLARASARAERAAADLGGRLGDGLREAQEALAAADGRLAAGQGALRADLAAQGAELAHQVQDRADAAEARAAGLDGRLQEVEGKAKLLELAVTGARASQEERAAKLEGTVGELQAHLARHDLPRRCEALEDPAVPRGGSTPESSSVF